MYSMSIITLFRRWACIHMNLPSGFDITSDTYCLSLNGCIYGLRESFRVVFMLKREVYMRVCLQNSCLTNVSSWNLRIISSVCLQCSLCNRTAARQWRWEMDHHRVQRVVHTWQKGLIKNWSFTVKLVTLTFHRNSYGFPTIRVYKSPVTSNNSFSPSVLWHFLTLTSAPDAQAGHPLKFRATYTHRHTLTGKSPK